MTVFISYRHSDREQAIAINHRLNQAGITTYLDVLDAESQTTDDITGVITRNISRCSHLIAVISEQTAKSWWVPFEIGEATITSRRITSYRTGFNRLPEYLEKWPQMTKPSDIDLFIKVYNSEGSTSRSMVINESNKAISSSSADLFHENLKTKIKRGF